MRCPVFHLPLWCASLLAALLLVAGCDPGGDLGSPTADALRSAASVRVTATASPPTGRVGTAIDVDLVITTRRSITGDVRLVVVGPDGTMAYSATWPAQSLSPSMALTLTEPVRVEAGDPVGSYRVDVTVQRTGGGRLFEGTGLTTFNVLGGTDAGMTADTGRATDASTTTDSGAVMDAGTASGRPVNSSSLVLSSTTPRIGDTLSGSSTLTNASAVSVTLDHVVIAARPPGGTNAGGPDLDLYQASQVTLAPGQSWSLHGGRTLTSSDPTGHWYAYVTYLYNGTWYDASPTNFTVSAATPTDAGTRPDGGSTSDAGSASDAGSPTRACSSPAFTTSDTNGGWSNGGYYVHNNVWNAGEAGPETLYACAYDNWYVDSTQPDSTSVKSYPNVHLDIDNLNGAPLANYHTITSTFAGAGPGVGIYDVAYDIWLNGVGWGNGTTEYMIWTENHDQRPLGSVQGTVTSNGVTFDAWHYQGDGANVISLVPRATLRSGTLNLRELFDWAIARSWLPASATINQIGYGVEVCSTNNTRQRFTFTDFSVTMH